ncbi:Arm DNA-binding domain-containing protein [Neptuniibacter halophilus]|uniref:Arm DNA-binding domain-containing protein n=1 Tax=Neptuniibacter halophilus TaxID=651666 RepID=UPI0025723C3B|nr:DUF3596 domain-containing protein [Neptuniibacter halophilus]
MAGRKIKLPRGIKIRKGKTSESIQIAFTYKGVQCRELLQMPATAGNLKYAANLRHEILAEIERGTFSYIEKFPDSKRAAKFGFNTQKPLMKDQLTRAFGIKKDQVKPSSIKAYHTSLTTHLMPAFGHLRVDLVTPAIVRDWFVESGLSAKTLRNHRILLDMALNMAVQDGIISRNPTESLRLEHILPKKRQKSDYKPDPFNKEEISKIIAAADEWYRPMLITWLFTGMRPSELIALTWKDINLEDRFIDVNKGHVLGDRQTPKTESSVRLIDMLPPVYDALIEQRKKTLFLNGEDGQVFRTKKSKTCFLDHRNLGRYVWKPTIARAKIRYRNQYQARHTFASQMLTEGNDIWWLAQQLGHKGVDMINRVYGQWIQDNNKSRYEAKGNWEKVVSNSHDYHTNKIST